MSDEAIQWPMSVTLCSLSNDAARSFTNEKVAIDVPRPACPRREALFFCEPPSRSVCRPDARRGASVFCPAHAFVFCRAVTHRSGSWENVWQPSPCPRGPLAYTTSTPKLTVEWSYALAGPIIRLPFVPRPRVLSARGYGRERHRTTKRQACEWSGKHVATTALSA